MLTMQTMGLKIKRKFIAYNNKTFSVKSNDSRYPHQFSLARLLVVPVGALH